MDELAADWMEFMSATSAAGEGGVGPTPSAATVGFAPAPDSTEEITAKSASGVSGVVVGSAIIDGVRTAELVLVGELLGVAGTTLSI